MARTREIGWSSLLVELEDGSFDVDQDDVVERSHESGLEHSFESSRGKVEPKFHREVGLQDSANSDDVNSRSKAHDPKEGFVWLSVVKENDEHPGDNVISYGINRKEKDVMRVSRAVQSFGVSAAEPHYECEQCHKVFRKR
ncbi:hypothetical protein NDN08_003234 [Rhodosorus marinus]|uniref:Uncharacterized protein n=1 Tax=Rhodosorus marinus TaxID=101924 RepID=A0AAV8UWA3_9RHOD|nr:hypothetical protein NDN08_003234 [Rhodosorus marinus]